MIEYIESNIGFSWRGTLVVLLALLPNIVFAILPPAHMPENLRSGGLVWDLLENITRVVFIMLLVSMTKNGKGHQVYLVIAGLALLIYYYMWMKYFMGGREYASLFVDSFMRVPLPMAVFPVIYFFCMGAWFQNPPIMICVGLFGMVHIYNSYRTLQQCL